MTYFQNYIVLGLVSFSLFQLSCAKHEDKKEDPKPPAAAPSDPITGDAVLNSTKCKVPFSMSFPEAKEITIDDVLKENGTYTSDEVQLFSFVQAQDEKGKPHPAAVIARALVVDHDKLHDPSTKEEVSCLDNESGTIHIPYETVQPYELGAPTGRIASSLSLASSKTITGPRASAVPAANLNFIAQGQRPLVQDELKVLPPTGSESDLKIYLRKDGVREIRHMRKRQEGNQVSFSIVRTTYRLRKAVENAESPEVYQDALASATADFFIFGDTAQRLAQRISERPNAKKVLEIYKDAFEFAVDESELDLSKPDANLFAEAVATNSASETLLERFKEIFSEKSKKFDKKKAFNLACAGTQLKLRERFGRP